MKALFERDQLNSEADSASANPTVTKRAATVLKPLIDANKAIKVQLYEKPTKSRQIPLNPVNSLSATYPVVSHESS